MAKQIMRKTTLERSELYTFCDGLPAPVMAVACAPGTVLQADGLVAV